ncbi:MAG: tyrosine-type recombinase/integrase [Puniceicoccaceae bacterium]
MNRNGRIRHLARAVRQAAIAKRSNSHVLRHSYATHLLESGLNIRTVQDCLDYTCIETTMFYLHGMEDSADRLLSPMDNLVARA